MHCPKLLPLVSIRKISSWYLTKDRQWPIPRQTVTLPSLYFSQTQISWGAVRCWPPKPSPVGGMSVWHLFSIIICWLRYVLAFLLLLKHVLICLEERRGDRHGSSTKWKCKLGNSSKWKQSMSWKLTLGEERGLHAIHSHGGGFVDTGGRSKLPVKKFTA